MITNKDISIDKNGRIILNGDKYPLASQAEIDAVKDDIDDLDDKIGDITQTGVTGDTVAAQILQLNSKLTKVALDITTLQDSSWTESPVSGMYMTRIALPQEYSGRTLISAIIRRKYSGDDYTFIGNYNNFGTSDKDITILSITNRPRAIGLDLYYEAAQNN